MPIEYSQMDYYQSRNYVTKRCSTLQSLDLDGVGRRPGVHLKPFTTNERFSAVTGLYLLDFYLIMRHWPHISLACSGCAAQSRDL